MVRFSAGGWKDCDIHACVCEYLMALSHQRETSVLLVRSAIKNLLAGKKGRKKGGGGAAGTERGGGGGGGDGGGGRRASQFDDLDEAEDQQQTERGDHLLVDDEDGSAAAGDDASQEGDKSKDLGQGYAPPWAGGEGEIPWDDDESRPESHYEFGAGDRLLNPKLFLTHPPVIFDPVEDRVRSR
jgi:hypothetical protein